MTKRPFFLLFLCGLCASMALFIVSIASNPPIPALYGIAFVYMFAAIGLLLLWDWMRITLLIFSWLFLVMTGSSYMILRFGHHNYFRMILILTPVWAFNLLSIVFLNRDHIKQLFYNQKFKS